MATVAPPPTETWTTYQLGRRDKYAMDVQTVAAQEIESLSGRQALRGVKWASSLEAAPAAVSIMAILLKTASKGAAAGLSVASREIRGDGGVVIAMLPQTLFHSNLEYCTEQGRQAFVKSQETMALIQKTSEGMIKDGGSVAYIIELLEDMDDAKKNLLPEIREVERCAQSCLTNLKQLCEKFEFWYLVIVCLKNNATESSGHARAEFSDTARDQSHVKEAEKLHKDMEAIAREAAGEKQKQLDDTIAEIEAARREVKILLEQPPIAEPSIQQELEAAEKAVSAMQPPEKKGGAVGAIKKGWTALVGESKKEYEARTARFEELQRQRDEYMKKKQAERDLARQRAEDRLNFALAREEKLKAEIEQAREDLNKRRSQHSDARAKLAETREQLKRLGEANIELKTIFKILDKSTEQLAHLKEHVSQLVQFFNAILVEVSAGVVEDVKGFLNPIKQSAGVDDDDVDGELDAPFSIGKASKKRILSKALHIQTSFSAIRDISGTFVKVSTDYIVPAISKMEALAVTQDKDWETKSHEFSAWCEKSMLEIRALAATTETNMRPNMVGRVEYLTQHMIDVVD
ncbi:hypothetical protein F5144DRAFT_90241 [Chaetomium tenue]|uniref:Uncharacterized protein n=1 Tax=Chaetomium tenue TaxID=1854479 RepID=A0ACB7PGW2_9PEZI|nr:hypothetical protein F5144DRAFT_90241 [Chaetomium globosum]